MAIYKLQLPLTSNVPDPKALAYKRDRKFMVEVPVDQALKDFFVKYGGKYCVKLFVYAEIGEDHLLHIEKVAPEQGW
jgi:hypothetical protein